MEERVSDSDELILSSSDIFTLSEDVLKKGGSLRFTAKGFSMRPSIKNNDIVTVSPVDTKKLRVGDVILFRKDEDSQVTVHRLRKIDGDRFLTKGDNSSEDDGWISKEMISGFISKVERDGHRIFWITGPDSSVIKRFIVYCYLGILELRRVYRKFLIMKLNKRK